MNGYNSAFFISTKEFAASSPTEIDEQNWIHKCSFLSLWNTMAMRIRHPRIENQNWLLQTVKTFERRVPLQVMALHHAHSKRKNEFWLGHLIAEIRISSIFMRFCWTIYILVVYFAISVAQPTHLLMHTLCRTFQFCKVKKFSIWE